MNTFYQRKIKNNITFIGVANLNQHKIQCPGCLHEFLVDEFDNDECPKCKEYYYYWDSVMDEDTFEEYFQGFYWERKRTK